MNDIEKAEKDMRDLSDQRENLLGRTKTLAVQRQQISHAAYTGNPKARQQLDKLNAESQTMGLELENIQAAIAQAQSILGAARQTEAMAADRERANKIAVLNAKLKEELDNADDAFSDAVSSVLSARNLLTELHALGVTSPTDQMFRINAVVAIKTTIQELPNNWVNDFEFMRLAPSQKKSFKNIVGGMCAQIANQIAGRLGDQNEKAA